MKLIICKPDFRKKHFTENIFRKKYGIDFWCFIHAITFGMVFKERDWKKHQKANLIHIRPNVIKESECH